MKIGQVRRTYSTQFVAECSSDQLLDRKSAAPVLRTSKPTRYVASTAPNSPHTHMNPRSFTAHLKPAPPPEDQFITSINPTHQMLELNSMRTVLLISTLMIAFTYYYDLIHTLPYIFLQTILAMMALCSLIPDGVWLTQHGTGAGM